MSEGKRTDILLADEGNKCPICQDTEMFKEMYALPCAHKFHEQCINEWLKKKLECPICRLSIGNEGNVCDEGLGESQFEIPPISRFRDESLTSDEDNSTGPIVLVGEYDGRNYFPTFNTFSSNTESDTDFFSDEINDEPEASGSFAEQEASEYETEQDSESCDEPEVIELNDGIYVSESDDELENAEPEAGESDGNTERSESDDNNETSESDDNNETSESDGNNETSESDDNNETSESDGNNETSESDDDQETSESDDDQENSELDNETEISDSEDELELSESNESELSELVDESDVSESNSESNESYSILRLKIMITNNNNRN